MPDFTGSALLATFDNAIDEGAVVVLTWHRIPCGSLAWAGFESDIDSCGG